MKLYNLIAYSGIAAIVFLFATFIFGIARLNYEVHEKLAITTIVLALLHGGLILYRMIKIKISQNLFR